LISSTKKNINNYLIVTYQFFNVTYKFQSKQ